MKKWSCTSLQIIPKDWKYRFAEQVNWWITVIIYFFIHVIKRGVCDAMFPRCTIFKYPQCEVTELPNMMSSPDAPVSRSLLAMLPKLTYQAVYPSQCVYRHLARVCTTDWIVPESLRGPSQLSQFTQRLWFTSTPKLVIYCIASVCVPLWRLRIVLNLHWPFEDRKCLYCTTIHAQTNP